MRRSDSGRFAERYDHVLELLETGYTHRFRHESLRRTEDGKWETIMRQTTRKNYSSLLRPQVTVVYLAREEGDFAAAPRSTSRCS